MDIFEECIEKHKRDENCRALTCKSYGKVYQNKRHQLLNSNQTNYELATYGDALMKFALCSLFLDKVEQLSEFKKEYEEDKFLIEVVAKHYNLLDYMNFDRDDEKIPQKYLSETKNNSTKYIATTVEAVLGAIYQEKNDFNCICKLIKSWTKLK